MCDEEAVMSDEDAAFAMMTWAVSDDSFSDGSYVDDLSTISEDYHADISPMTSPPGRRRTYPNSLKLTVFNVSPQ